MMTPIARQEARPRAISARQANIARGVIVSSALLVLALLAWTHLGLGALLFPPAPSPATGIGGTIPGDDAGRLWRLGYDILMQRGTTNVLAREAFTERGRTHGST